ncbi:MAG TPA: phosphotransferase, partial [Chitinophagaceae bacterium]
KQFKESLHTRQYERLAKAASFIEELKKREHYASLYDVITESDEFHLRVMHHDAKIANVLFDEESGNVVCLVDFDTVMPGYFFSDLGDMIRSMACNEDETSTNFDSLQIRKEYYEAILEGYLSVMNDQLTEAEKKYIHFSGIVMLYMQALRFMTDYLSGDKYYRVEYPEQNFDRSRNQLVLLQRLEEFLQQQYQFKV